MLCSQMALAAVVSVIADRYSDVHGGERDAQAESACTSHFGRRTAGSSSNPAKQGPPESQQHAARFGRPDCEHRRFGEQSARAPHHGGQHDPQSPADGGFSGDSRT